jgi:hypothetical protein
VNEVEDYKRSGGFIASAPVELQASNKKTARLRLLTIFGIDGAGTIALGRTLFRNEPDKRALAHIKFDSPGLITVFMYDRIDRKAAYEDLVCHHLVECFTSELKPTGLQNVKGLASGLYDLMQSNR